MIFLNVSRGFKDKMVISDRICRVIIVLFYVS